MNNVDDGNYKSFPILSVSSLNPYHHYIREVDRTPPYRFCGTVRLYH